MNDLCRELLCKLQNKTLAVAESCTGGGIGAALTAVPGSSTVFKGGVICYTNWVKENMLGVGREVLEQFGAVSRPVAGAMAAGARKQLQADVAVSVTGLAGPGGDDYGNPVGTVYIGFESDTKSQVKHFRFSGDRESVRRQAAEAALRMIMDNM